MSTGGIGDLAGARGGCSFTGDAREPLDPYRAAVHSAAVDLVNEIRSSTKSHLDDETSVRVIA